MSSFEKIQSGIFAAVSALVTAAVFIGTSILPAEPAGFGSLFV